MMQQLMKRTSLRELRMVSLGIGTIVTAALAVSIMVPNLKSFRAAATTVSALETAAMDGVELQRHLQEKTALVEELKFRLHGDMAKLPAKEVEAYIIGRLQRISWNNDVELLSVEPASGDRVQIFQEMLFNVRLAGQYDDLYKWLWETRNELGFVVIKEYSLQRRDEADEQPRLLADLSLASYRAAE